MKPQIATATQRMHASADTIYEILADYRFKHSLILPKPYFLSLDVEEGGVGEGTIVNFKMRVLGRAQSFRSLITEPVPGRVLVETNIQSGIPTTFRVSPLADETPTKVTISTELRNRGVVESWILKYLLQKIYRQELQRLAFLANPHTGIVLSTTPAALTTGSRHSS